MSNCLYCKKCVADPEVGYECGLNTSENWIYSWKDQCNDKPCIDFELDREYLEKQLSKAKGCFKIN